MRARTDIDDLNRGDKSYNFRQFLRWCGRMSESLETRFNDVLTSTRTQQQLTKIVAGIIGVLVTIVGASLMTSINKNSEAVLAVTAKINENSLAISKLLVIAEANEPYAKRHARDLEALKKDLDDLKIQIAIMQGGGRTVMPVPPPDRGR